MTRRGRSLTAELVALIDGKAIAEPDLRATALFTLDTVAGIVGARTSAVGRLVTGWALSEPLNPGRQALVLGALSNVLEMDSMHRGSTIHAGIVVVPAALALAQVTKSSGREVLSAILKGCEAAFRIGAAAGPAHYRMYQNTATCGPYGAALAAACLLELNAEQTVHALGNAGTQAGGFWEFLSDSVMTKQLHAGRAAEAGIVAAQLAGRGFTGPATILEGPKGFFRAACPDADPEAVLRAPEAPWGLRGNSYKPWPTPRHTHPAIDAALALGADIGGRPIERVEIDTYQVALDLCNVADPQTEQEAKFSLRYCVAAALGDRELGFSSFGEEARARHQALMRRIAVGAREPFLSAYPKAWGAEIRVRLADGACLTLARPHAKGDPECPMSEDEIVEKARELARIGGEDDVDAILSRVLGMIDGGAAPMIPITA